MLGSVSVPLAVLQVRSNSRQGFFPTVSLQHLKCHLLKKQHGDLGECSDMSLAVPCAVLSADKLLRGHISGGFLFYGLGKNFFEKNASEHIHINLIDIFSQAAT